MSQSSNKKAPLKPVNQPFEQTFRLQVHLPRNQLYVARVSPKAVLSDILMQVCSEKNLDSSRYSLRHPNNLDQVLNLSCTLADYKLQEVTLVYNRSLPVEVSTVDIMALQRDTTVSAYNNFTLPRNNRSCEGSVSSGSLGGRSLSPVHSDESSASPPPPPPSRPIRKRRPAPKPPTINDKQMNGGDKIQMNASQTVGQTATVICHSRNSSDSSGYHEASVLSESPQSNSLPDSLPRRSKLPSVSTSELTQSACEVSNNLSRSLSNLTAVGNTVQQTNMRQYNHSTSAISLSTIGGRKKKSAPPPPPLAAAAKMSSVNEEDQKLQQQRTASVSSITSSTTTLSGSDSNSTRKSATLPRLSSTSSSTSTTTNPETTPVQTVPPPSVKVDTVGSVVENPTQPPVDSIPGRFVSLSPSKFISETKKKLNEFDDKLKNVIHPLSPSRLRIFNNTNSINDNANNSLNSKNSSESVFSRHKIKPEFSSKLDCDKQLQKKEFKINSSRSFSLPGRELFANISNLRRSFVSEKCHKEGNNKVIIKDTFEYFEHCNKNNNVYNNDLKSLENICTDNYKNYAVNNNFNSEPSNQLISGLSGSIKKSRSPIRFTTNYDGRGSIKSIIDKEGLSICKSMSLSEKIILFNQHALESNKIRTSNNDNNGIKSYSFCDHTDYIIESRIDKNVINTCESFRIKMHNLKMEINKNSNNDNNNNNNNLSKQNHNTDDAFDVRKPDIPIKCNLLQPPPENLLINRRESSESWNNFLQQLDYILINKAGEYV